MSDSEWCPTQTGSTTAYRPQYFNEAKKEWQDIPIVRIQSQHGLPYPFFTGPLMEFVDLFGYEQAMALAWQYAAVEATQARAVSKVRVMPYELKYEIKAKERPDLLPDLDVTSATKGRGE